MSRLVISLCKKYCLLLLPLVLLAGCSSLSNAQTAAPPAATPTHAVQTNFNTYVGKWEVHGSLLNITANQAGVVQWNAGPCTDADDMCAGNAQITFTANADGSITATIQSVSYSLWSGSPAPAGYQPSADDPKAGDTFQLQHSGTHLLYTTWLGAKSSLNNEGNRYWCDTYALSAGWQQCGA
jgi:hypothetical protein